MNTSAYESVKSVKSVVLYLAEFLCQPRYFMQDEVAFVGQHAARRSLVAQIHFEPVLWFLCIRFRNRPDDPFEFFEVLSESVDFIHQVLESFAVEFHNCTFFSFMFNFVDFCRDSAIGAAFLLRTSANQTSLLVLGLASVQASLMAFAASKVPRIRESVDS